MATNDGGHCLEIASCPRTVYVRDSKDPAGPQLAFPARSWSTFLTNTSR